MARTRYSFTYEHGAFGVDRCLTVRDAHGMQIAQFDPFAGGIPCTTRRINARIRKAAKEAVAEYEARSPVGSDPALDAILRGRS